MTSIIKRKIMTRPQVAKLTYREVVAKGEECFPCVSGQSDQELIQQLISAKPELKGRNLEIEIERV
jgi:hypothetical protein